jgi:hypothetical protein
MSQVVAMLEFLFEVKLVVKEVLVELRVLLVVFALVLLHEVMVKVSY